MHRHTHLLFYELLMILVFLFLFFFLFQVTYFDLYIFQLNLAVNSGEKQHHYGFLFASQEDVNKTAAYLLALMKSNFPDANVL